MNSQTLYALTYNAFRSNTDVLDLPRRTNADTNVTVKKNHRPWSKILKSVEVSIGDKSIELFYAPTGSILAYDTRLNGDAMKPTSALHMCFVAHDYLCENGHLAIGFLRELLDIHTISAMHYVERREKLEKMIATAEHESSKRASHTDAKKSARPVALLQPLGVY